MKTVHLLLGLLFFFFISHVLSSSLQNELKKSETVASTDDIIKEIKEKMSNPQNPLKRKFYVSETMMSIIRETDLLSAAFLASCRNAFDALRVLYFHLSGDQNAYAPETDNAELVRLFLRMINNRELEDFEGNTPLHIAAREGLLDIVQSRLPNTSDPNRSDKSGNTPYTLAVANGHFNVAMSLLDRIGVDHEDASGNTLLHIAAKKGSLDTVNDLLLRGCNRNKQNKKGFTPLMLAIENKHVEVAMLLLDNKANVSLKNIYGNTSFHLAAEKGQFDIVKRLWNEVEDINEINATGTTPLMLALKRGHSEIALFILRHMRKADKANHSGYTPLHYAAQMGLLDCVKLLLDKGSNANMQNNYGDTPFTLALDNGHVEAAIMLLDYIDVDQADENGNTPMHHAARNGHPDVVRHILTKRSNVNMKNKDEDTPLKLALDNGHVEVAIMLLDYIDVDQADENGNTPMHHAARNGLPDVVRHIFTKRGNANMQNNAGDTPFTLALKNRHVKVAEMILPRMDNIDQVYITKHPLLHYAASKGLLGIVKIILNKTDRINEVDRKDDSTPISCAISMGHDQIALKLLDEIADVDELDPRGNILLHYAAEFGRVHIIKILLARTKLINVNVPNKCEFTPFDNATSNGHNEAAKMILDRIDVDQADDDDNTLLHRAVNMGNLSAVQLILPIAKLINLKNRQGETPLELAQRKGRDEISELIRVKICSRFSPGTETGSRKFPN